MDFEAVAVAVAGDVGGGSGKKPGKREVPNDWGSKQFAVVVQGTDMAAECEDVVGTKVDSH